MCQYYNLSYYKAGVNMEYQSKPYNVNKHGFKNWIEPIDSITNMTVCFKKMDILELVRTSQIGLEFI